MRGPAPEPGAPPARAAPLGAVGAPRSALTPLRRAPAPGRTHTLQRAHTSDIPIVPHVTRPNVRTCPHAHARVHTRAPAAGAARLAPTPGLRPAEAPIDGDTPTLTRGPAADTHS